MGKLFFDGTTGELKERNDNIDEERFHRLMQRMSDIAQAKQELEAQEQKASAEIEEIKKKKVETELSNTPHRYVDNSDINVDINKLMDITIRRDKFKKRNADILGQGYTNQYIMQKIAEEPWRTSELEINISDIIAVNV